MNIRETPLNGSLFTAPEATNYSVTTTFAPIQITSIFDGV